MPLYIIKGIRLGLVAVPVIQAIGRPDFEDGLRMGTTMEVITDSHSICTHPEVLLKLMAMFGRFTAVRREHQT